MRVELGIKLIKQLQKRSGEDVNKVYKFVNHVKKHGLKKLEGRNKSSDNVPKDDPAFLAKVKRAQEKKFWHYHIGIHEYEPDSVFGDKTSKYILHYANHDPCYIRVAKLDYHPPFLLPYDSWLLLRGV